MKRKIVDILCCPLCKEDIILDTTESGEDIKTGTLYCKKCNIYYPIEYGIPNLLPPYYKKYCDIKDTHIR